MTGYVLDSAASGEPERTSSSKASRPLGATRKKTAFEEGNGFEADGVLAEIEGRPT
jgi:hypothetical protein